MEGIFTHDFYGEKEIIKINDPTNLSFDGLRCDPFFEESFETVPLGRYEGEDWSNFNTEGTQLWEVFEDENSMGQSIEIGAYRSGDTASVSWLISPQIDVSSLATPLLAFRTSTRFADKSQLEALISVDWDGQRSSLVEARWTPLSAQIVHKGDAPELWIDSGDIPVKVYQQFYLAFRYTGSGKTTSDGTYEVDDIRIFER